MPGHLGPGRNVEFNTADPRRQITRPGADAVFWRRADRGRDDDIPSLVLNGLTVLLGARLQPRRQVVVDSR